MPFNNNMLLVLVFPEKERNTTRSAIIIVVPIVIAMILVISICIFLRARKPKDTFESKLILAQLLLVISFWIEIQAIAWKVLHSNCSQWFEIKIWKVIFHLDRWFKYIKKINKNYFFVEWSKIKTNIFLYF